VSLAVKFNISRGDFNITVDLALPANGVTAIFGPSGSGKTTLLRALAGLERLPGAEIIFNDLVWQDNNTFVPAHERNIGYVFQEPSLFAHLSVRKNLEYGLSRVPGVNRRISLDDAISLLDISNLLERNPASLSGGEQQRVAIARTLATSPQLLLMDEPLSSLDNKLKQEILPYLETLHRELKFPVIYVSHATDEVARLADELVILRNGEILGSGPIQQMLTRLDLPLSHRGDVETLIQGTVKLVDDEFGLMHISDGSHDFMVTGTALAINTPVRLRISAHDVSLTLDHQEGTSIQNIFPVTIEEITNDGKSQVLVKALMGNNPLLARITRKSAEELAITPGRTMYAQIKGIAVLA